MSAASLTFRTTSTGAPSSSGTRRTATSASIAPSATHTVYVMAGALAAPTGQGRASRARTEASRSIQEHQAVTRADAECGDQQEDREHEVDRARLAVLALRVREQRDRNPEAAD